MAYFAEMTDTFGGNANYSWVRRIWIEHAPNLAAAMRLARAHWGWSGKRGRMDDYGDARHFWPRHACIVIMVRWSDSPEERASADLVPEPVAEWVRADMHGWAHPVMVRNAMCPDGRRRTVRLRQSADTFFSWPGRCTIGRRTVQGFVSARTDADGLAMENGDVAFHPAQSGGR